MSAVLLSQIVEDYLTARRARYAETTVKNEGHVLHRFVATRGDIQMRHLTPEHIETWFLSLLQPHTDRSGIHRPAIQPSSHNYYLDRLKSFFAYCTKRGLTRADLLAHVPPMKQATKIRLQPSPEVLWVMLDRAGDPRDRALIATAMNTGMRSGEIARIKVGDVDLDSLTLRVWVSKSLVEDDMPITSDLAAELDIWLAAYARSVERPLLRDDHVFPAATGPRYRWRVTTDGTKEKYQTPSTYVPHRPVTKLHTIAQSALRQVGLPTRHEGIHTIRRAVARAYYDSLKASGHEQAIRAVMILLHHTNQSTTEAYLGVTAERQFRDESLRGRSFLPRPTTADVIAISGRPARR
jgi:integrase/recombinase XerD